MMRDETEYMFAECERRTAVFTGIKQEGRGLNGLGALHCSAMVCTATWFAVLTTAAGVCRHDARSLRGVNNNCLCVLEVTIFPAIAKGTYG